MFSEPVHNVSQLRLHPGMIVADFGAGVGEYAQVAAGAVGKNGHVYAIEVQKNLIGRVEADMQEQGLDQVHVVWGDIEVSGGTRLRDESVDVVILANVLFQLDKKDGCLTEIRRVLKSDGQLLLVDWSESFGSMGPQPEFIVTAKQAEQLLGQTGFQNIVSFDAGPHHYGFTAVK